MEKVLIMYYSILAVVPNNGPATVPSVALFKPVAGVKVLELDLMTKAREGAEPSPTMFLGRI